MSTARAAAAWLRDIVTACQRIETYVARGRVAYDADPAILDALVFQLITIGEAAKALQQGGFDERFPELPWSADGAYPRPHRSASAYPTTMSRQFSKLMATNIILRRQAW